MPPEAVPARAPHVVFASLDGETVLYHLERAQPALLNVTAAAVWAAIDGRRTVGEISSMLAADFGSEHQVVAAGVEATLAALLEVGLIVHAERCS